MCDIKMFHIPYCLSRICQLSMFFFLIPVYAKLFSKLVEILPMQPSINTGLPKHPHLTLMTSVKSSNVKRKLRRRTCWGRLERWMRVGTAPSPTVNWKRPWPPWVAPGQQLASGFSPGWIVVKYSETLQKFYTVHNIMWDLLKSLSERRENDLRRSRRYFLITWHQ